MEKVKRRLGYENCFAMNSVGRARSLTMLWNNDLQVTCVETTNFLIEVQIQDVENNNTLWFVHIYASIDDCVRKKHGT